MIYQLRSSRKLAGTAYCQSRTKRLLDIIGAIIGMVIFAPGFVFAVALIKLFDNVPVFFFQERFGFRGQPFTIVKLRTLPLIEKGQDVNPQRIQRKPNYPTTRTGRFLRVTSLDEIPQFWLVLRGEMSLVGHRAFPTYYTPHLAEMPDMNITRAKHYLDTISQYKPGMTALSAINGRANLSLQEKITYDLQYAETASFWGDIAILLKTIVVVITREGAR